MTYSINQICKFINKVKTLTLVLRRRETPLMGLLRSLKAIDLGQVNEASGNKIRAENIPLVAVFKFLHLLLL
jgi:hypothetical protein